MPSYHNPVYPDYFADPFVWKHQGVYYAVGTGPVTGAKDRAFPLLRSENFVDWKFCHGALRVPEFAQGGEFWAPEVAFDGQAFFLYYSVATAGLNHQLRVARSASPEGPYEDAVALTDLALLSFAIDPHPFRDIDGKFYLFYARDFLDFGPGRNAGTALVVDELVGMTRLAGREQIVLRSTQPWQLFKARREMYGQVLDWHTLEGPCVRLHEGRYYCFYSGGCYENETYGVDYAVADQVTGPYRDDSASSGARVLQSVPGRVIGPGHTSIVQGPDEKTDFLVYHAWDSGMQARRMCLDPLEWTNSGPRCAGPSWTPQVLP